MDEQAVMDPVDQQSEPVGDMPAAPFLQYHKSNLKIKSFSVNKDSVEADLKVENSRTSDELSISKLNCMTGDLTGVLSSIIERCKEHFNLPFEWDIKFVSMKRHPKKGTKIDIKRFVEGIDSPLNISLPYSAELIEDVEFDRFQTEVVEFLIGAKENQLDMFEADEVESTAA